MNILFACTKRAIISGGKTFDQSEGFGGKNENVVGLNFDAGDDVGDIKNDRQSASTNEHI